MVKHPVVTGVSPKEGPPGTRVTIRGEFLGSSSTDLIGLKICGCDCLLSAEWKSPNKIVARSGPCKGRGDIIVKTRSGGEGTSTVQFRGYHESIGPVKESAVWVEETEPAALAWGRRPMSPASYAPPDPLGLSTEGDECKLPEEDLNEIFPDHSGKLSDENFHPGWYLLEHHCMTSFEDLRAGALFLERKVDSQKEGQLSFLKSNTGAVMEQLDRLILVKDTFEKDHRHNGKEPLISLTNAIEDSIRTADSLFSDILTRKDKADKTRAALALLTRHKFLFQLPAAIDRNIRKKEYDLVVNDYTRVKHLFGLTEVKLFQKILAEIDKRIFDLREKLHTRIESMPIPIQEQRKYIQILRSLQWEGDVAWDAINSRKDYLMSLLNKLRDHFKHKEQQELDKSKRKAGSSSDGSTTEIISTWVGASCGALVEEVGSLWTLARWYFAGELGGTPTQTIRSDDFKQMILSGVEVFAGHMRSALLVGGSGGAEAAGLVVNLQRLREAHEALLKLDLPSQPVGMVEKVIFEYRIYGMTGLLQKAVKRVKTLNGKETWNIEEYSDYGAITKLPRLFESYVTDALSSIHTCVAEAGRRESPLFENNNNATTTLHKHIQELVSAYVVCLQKLAMDDDDQDFNNTSLSVTLGNQKLEGDESGRVESSVAGKPSWQQRLLVSEANSQYTRHVTLNNIAKLFDKYSFPKPTMALHASSEALRKLEGSIAETYLEHKGDPLVGTIEPSMFMGRYKFDGNHIPKDARPYVYEIINNLIAVHAEMDSVCTPSSQYVASICKTVCEELARLAATLPEPATRAARLQSTLELRMLHAAVNSLLTREAQNYLMEAMGRIPPLDNDEDVRLVEKIVSDFQKRTRLQIMSLNANTETV